MTVPIEVQPGDRVLLLSIPEASFIRGLASELPSGIVIGLGSNEEAGEARRATGDLENTMFTPGSPADIPWQDGFFSKAIDFTCGWSDPEKALRELARVLSPGGVAYLAFSGLGTTAAPDTLFTELAPAGAFRVLQRR